MRVGAGVVTVILSSGKEEELQGDGGGAPGWSVVTRSAPSPSPASLMLLMSFGFGRRRLDRASPGQFLHHLSIHQHGAVAFQV